MNPPAEMKDHPVKTDVHTGPMNVHPDPIDVQPVAIHVPLQPIHLPPGSSTAPVVYYSHLPPFGKTPVFMTCPSCRAEIRSTMDYEASTTTHIIACITCLICFPFTCLPYFIDDLKNVNHYCPKCNTFLGTYKHG